VALGVVAHHADARRRAVEIVRLGERGERVAPPYKISATISYCAAWLRCSRAFSSPVQLIVIVASMVAERFEFRLNDPPALIEA
jgi:hypothetical protein